MVFENRVLRRTFSATWNDVTGGWIQLHNEGVRNLRSSPYFELMWQDEEE
jgi:hypothetical protein